MLKFYRLSSPAAYPIACHSKQCGEHDRHPGEKVVLVSRSSAAGTAVGVAAGAGRVIILVSVIVGTFVLAGVLTIVISGVLPLPITHAFRFLLNNFSLNFYSVYSAFRVLSRKSETWKF